MQLEPAGEPGPEMLVGARSCCFSVGMVTGHESFFMLIQHMMVGNWEQKRPNSIELTRQCVQTTNYEITTQSDLEEN